MNIFIYLSIYLCREVDWFSEGEGRVSTTENVAIFVWNRLVNLIPHPAKLSEVQGLFRKRCFWFSYPYDSIILHQAIAFLAQYSKDVNTSEVFPLFLFKKKKNKDDFKY